MSRFKMMTVLLLLSALVGGSAHAADPEFLCASGLAKARGKYLACVHKILGSLYLGGALGSVAKCHTRYDDSYTKLRRLVGTSCEAPRWVDNGDGTVRDSLTGLVWEKKGNLDGMENASDPHDADNVYWWTDAGDADEGDPDGTIYSAFLASLNAGGGFAGSTGWRLPTLAELSTIVLPHADSAPCDRDPCMDPVFGPGPVDRPERGSFYWTSSTLEYDPTGAWLVWFLSGWGGRDFKTEPYYVRAVHSGF